MIVAFIDDHRHEFGVELIVHALSGTAARIAVSSYYAYKKREPSARARRDQALMVLIQDVYEANYSCYGVRKMSKAINHDYADQFGPVARCTVERLMRQLGIDGIRRKRKRPKTASARAEGVRMISSNVSSQHRHPTVCGSRTSRMFRRLLGGCTRRSSLMSSTGRSTVGR